MRKAMALVAGAGLLLALSAPSGLATETTTEHQKRTTETFTEQLPCVGEAVITITYNAVFHTTENKNGSHVTGTLTGKFSADPVAEGIPNYVGRFTQWFGENLNKKTENATFTFSVTGRAVDRSGRIRFHQVAHITTNQNGTVVEFDKMSC